MVASTVILVAASMAVGPVAPNVAPAGDVAAVNVANPLRVARAAQTIALRIADVRKVAPALEPRKTIVVDEAGKAVESQLVDLDDDGNPDELVFQSAFAASETRKFVLRSGVRHPVVRDDFKVYGRFVRERHDDFAWENDRVAHRMYGPGLETWKAEPLVSSGVDVWSKRVRKLVINSWYMTDNYHDDGGEGADLYSVGKSRGCGGLGVWAGGKLYVSRNFVQSRVLANGPLRLVFELDYAPWDAGGVTVSETKRVTLDAGQHFNRFESVFQYSRGSRGRSLSLGIGIAQHQGGVVHFDKRGGWMSAWEPLKQGNGTLGCATLVAVGTSVDTKATELDNLMIVNEPSPGPLTYYVGTAWDRSGDVADQAAWSALVAAFAREVSAPLRIELASAEIAAAPPVKPDARVNSTSGSASDFAADRRWAARTCDSEMALGPVLTEKWSYDAGLVLLGCLRLWEATGDGKYLSFVRRSVDHLIDSDGVIKGYKLDDYNLDNINMGKVLFPLLAASTDAVDKARYSKALTLLRSQLKTQPRTADGAFWHKRIYPHQMWLDGVYMASPFLAEFASVFKEPSAFDDVATQIVLAEKHMRDPKTGLLYHGWDESKEQRWANPRTGTSSQFWARSMGWYAMAVVDVLDWMPRNHPRRPQILAVLRRLATAIASVQDKASGVWWQILDAAERPRNYRESSASAMFVYALAKGIKHGWLDATFAPVVSRGYRGIIETFVVAEPDGRVGLKNICVAAGLGGNPYRDGSFEYYSSIETATDDFKGLGAFILASVVAQ